MEKTNLFASSSCWEPNWHEAKDEFQMSERDMLEARLRQGLREFPQEVKLKDVEGKKINITFSISIVSVGEDLQ